MTGAASLRGSLMARWAFVESRPPFVSDDGRIELLDGAGSAVVADGRHGEPHSALFDGRVDYLVAGSEALNLAGADGCSVFAWVKRSSAEMHFIAGLWQEDAVAPGRQYGLFVNLPMYGGEQRVCGHVSHSGGATPGYPYSRDYSASARPVNLGSWSHIGFTYDGQQIISYLDGAADPWPRYEDPQNQVYAKNPYRFDEGLNPRPVGEFTVGANRVSEGMRMHFCGRLAELAVHGAALSPRDVRSEWAAGRSRLGL